MTSFSGQSMTCAEFQALLTDYLETHALSSAQRAAADAHAGGCVECSALVADVRTIVRDAGELPALTPGRDLWGGIEGRIEASVVAITARTGERRKAYGDSPDERRKAYGDRGALSVRRLAIAASVLVAVTAGVTYTLTKRQADLAVTPDSARQTDAARLSPLGAGRLAPLVRSAGNRPTAEQTFDLEIAAIRKVADARRSELDTATIRIVEKDLKLIDAAIAESKHALPTDPASAFLMDQLTHAYDAKLRFLRGLATLPARS
jgi:hypothetical protein